MHGENTAREEGKRRRGHPGLLGVSYVQLGNSLAQGTISLLWTEDLSRGCAEMLWEERKDTKEREKPFVPCRSRRIKQDVAQFCVQGFVFHGRKRGTVAIHYICVTPFT